MREPRGQGRACRACRFWDPQRSSKPPSSAAIAVSSAPDRRGLMRKPHAPFDGAKPTSPNLKRQPWRGVGAPQTLPARTRALLARRLACSAPGGAAGSVRPRVCSRLSSRPGLRPLRAAAQDEAGSPLALGVLLPLRVGTGHRLPLPLPGRSPAAARLPRAGRRLPRQWVRGPPVSSEGRWGLGARRGRGLGAGDAWWSGGWRQGH